MVQVLRRSEDSFVVAQLLSDSNLLLVVFGHSNHL